jgi:hypothetical protein
LPAVRRADAPSHGARRRPTDGCPGPRRKLTAGRGSDAVIDPVGMEAEAPHGYEIFQKKQDGAIKVVLRP